MDPGAVAQGGLIPAGAGRTASTAGAASRRRAHPRWRGEDVARAENIIRARGSSPLARGGPAPTTKGGRTTRLIPAGAGRTTRATTFCSICRAHPRWRGEDRHPTPRIPVRAGSSPLARGGLPADAHDHAQRRLIPAGAGRTENVDQRVIGTGAHPRWRGEDRLGGDFFLTGPGSSPLARGGPGQAHPHRVIEGLIPAGAGRTLKTTLRPVMSSAHPRWRGEDGVTAAVDQLSVRLIPAGAGRTVGCDSASGGGWAHPRWRGEDILAETAGIFGLGSSPLARGGHVADVQVGDLLGLIPAGAGRTVVRRRSCTRRTAHPRWRGEDPVLVGSAVVGVGSSPLARGGHGSRVCVPGCGGLIPAGAGRTLAELQF